MINTTSIQGDIEVVTDENSWVVSYNYRSGSKGTRWEPPEGSEIEIVSMVSDTGKTFEGDDALEQLKMEGLRPSKFYGLVDDHEARYLESYENSEYEDPDYY
ncbi:MAG: hypothetical protein VXX04_01845 [Actinomycetota bacterium]|nr:hypothetical protein [Actinomycetota bacterium]